MDVALPTVTGVPWTVYPWIALRSAGFPATTVLQLAAPELCTPAVRTRPGEGSAYETMYEAARQRTGDAIRQLCRRRDFQEAIVWQNRRAYQSAIRPLTERSGAPTGSDRRQRYPLVALYLQRYCLKNDTIGFFGPGAWARVAGSGPALVCDVSATVVAERRVFFEPWTIDVIAQALSEDAALKPWMAPRRLPHVGLHGTTLSRGDETPNEISDRLGRLLASCTGKLVAHAIAAALVADARSGFTSMEQVFAELAALERDRLIAWRFEVPLDLDPASRLRSVLEPIEPVELRRRALAPLLELEAARNEVASAAGKVMQLDAALEHIETTFHRLTDRAPHRLPGATYGGRTLVYEDCTRGVDVTLGPPLITRLGPPLSLIGAAARWLTHRVAACYRTAFEALYRELTADGPAAVPLIRFLKAAAPLFTSRGTGRSELVEDVRADLLERWDDLLGRPRGRHEVRVTSESLAPPLLERFSCPGPGWGFAVRHSVDVLLGASSVDAVAAGRYQPVVSQIHVASATLLNACLFATHPDPDALRTVQSRDLPDPVVYLQSSGRHARTRPAALPTRTLFVDLQDELAADPDQALHLGDLVVEAASEGLRVCDPAHGTRIDLLDFLASSLSTQSRTAFGILPRAEHTPRVTIDDVVVAREQWSFAASEMKYAFVRSAAERFLLVRSWAEDHALPRFFFVRPPITVEVKPLFCDLDSPLYVDLLCKTIRRTRDAGAGSISITEMLPDIADCWLADRGGGRYTSELRLVMLDPLSPTYGRS